MKKLIVILTLLVSMISLSAQVGTYRVFAAQITTDGTWEDSPPVDLSGKGVYIVYYIDMQMIKISNKDNSKYFIKSGEVNEEPDDNGDVLSTILLSCLDKNGTECIVALFYWNEGLMGFADGANMVMRVAYSDAIIEYRCQAVNYEEK